MRVAIVHHWFVTRGGGERVAECIASLFPDADIFTLLTEESGVPSSLKSRQWHTSFLQKLPLARSYHRHLMPLYPAATESLDLRGFDLVISSDSGPVKGVRLDPGAIHLCYCHSPMRYLYDGYEQYRARMGAVTRAVFTASAGRVRAWDVRAAARVTHFIANSNYVASRIQRFYGRDSTVINPPIDLRRAQSTIRTGTSASRDGGHYLCAGRLVPYKRTDLMVEACVRMGRRLRVAGTGPDEARLKRLAPPGVTFLGELTTEALWQEYADSRALLFAADEDFGMVPLEAQACGRPVIAYGAGGSLETVRAEGEKPTGIFFEEQTVDSAVDAIRRFETMEQSFDPEAIRQHAAAFSTEIFLSRMRQFILEKVPGAASALAPEN